MTARGVRATNAGAKIQMSAATTSAAAVGADAGNARGSLWTGDDARHAVQRQKPLTSAREKYNITNQDEKK